MRLFVRTLNFAEGAIGLGVDELRWPNAVRPGDVLTVETEILELRPSRSRPGHGIIRLRNVTTNQRGEVVQTMLASAMVPKAHCADHCINAMRGRIAHQCGRSPELVQFYSPACCDRSGLKSSGNGASKLFHSPVRG